MKYDIWRHHKLILSNATFEECKAFLIEHDGDDYENCTHAMHTLGENYSETSLQGMLWMTEYASIKPTKETLRMLDELDTKAEMEVIDHTLTYGE